MNTVPPTAMKPSPPPLTMEAYREAAFRQMVVRRMHEGKALGQSPAAIASAIAEEQRALAQAITQPALLDIATRALMDAQAALLTEPRYRSAPVPAHESVRQIMHRRAKEAQRMADLLSQPDYVAMLAATPPVAADAVVPSLRDVKMKEVLGDLLHLENGAPQVIAHMDATAKGAMFTHEALAAMFASDGALSEALSKELTRLLPTASPAAIHRLAGDWLSARQAAAKLTSELAANDGAAYREAIRQSTAWHRQSHDAAVTSTPPVTVVHKAGLEIQPSAREREQAKDKQQRAEDVAYTINHALSCGTTDVLLQPIIAAVFDKNIGCADPSHADHNGKHHDGHGHGHEHHGPGHEHHGPGHEHHGPGHEHHGPGHEHHGPAHKTPHPAKPKLTLKAFAHTAGHYLEGEVIGDVAAVPLTIGVQRFFPNFMHGIRKLTEPLFGWAFRAGANRTARHWAQEQGLANSAPEVKAHAEEIYQHEISHLPQAVVWNMFAYPIGAVAQLKRSGYDLDHLPRILKSKLVGALVSNSILIGGRMIAPGAAQKWDAAMGERVLLPVGKKVGKLFGVDEKTMELAANKGKRYQAAAWATRVADEPQADDSRQATRISK